jgi:phosphate/sulfate permease
MDPIFGAGIVYLFLALLVGLYARGKGRSGLGFFLLSVVFSPLIGFIIALIVAPIKKN